MEEIRKAFNIIKDAIGYDRRTKEYKALKIIENELFSEERMTEAEIEAIIDEVMGSEG